MGRPGCAGATGFLGPEGLVARGRYDQKKPFIRAAMERSASGGGIAMGASDSARSPTAGESGGSERLRCSGAGTEALRYSTGRELTGVDGSPLEIATASSSRCE